MSNELLSCPFCGSDVEANDTNYTVWHHNENCPLNNLCITVVNWNTRATPQPIDVEALKREVCETVTHNIQKVGAVYAVNVVSDIIDHLAATGRLKV